MSFPNIICKFENKKLNTIFVLVFYSKITKITKKANLRSLGAMPPAACTSSAEPLSAAAEPERLTGAKTLVLTHEGGCALTALMGAAALLM